MRGPGASHVCVARARARVDPPRYQERVPEDTSSRAPRGVAGRISVAGSGNRGNVDDEGGRPGLFPERARQATHARVLAGAGRVPRALAV